MRGRAGRRAGWIVALALLLAALLLAALLLAALGAGALVSRTWSSTRTDLAAMPLDAVATPGVPHPNASSAVAAPATTPSPPPVPLPSRRLDVTTHPPGAQVTVTPATGAAQSGPSPFSATLDGGPAEVSVTLDGHNPLVQQVVLDEDRALDLWLDPAGLLHHKVAEFPTGPAPKQVAFTPDGRELWATLLGGAGVQVFDPLTGQQLAQIDLGEYGAVEVIFSADGATAYASQMETASVWEIDRATHTVRRQLATQGVWSKVMALSPDGATLYVSNWSSNDVSEIDLGTGQVRRVLDTVTTPRGLYPAPDGTALYVAGYEGGEIARIDLANGSSHTLIGTGGAMRHLVGDPGRGLLYANDMGGDQTFVVDLATGEVRPLAATDEKPNTTDLTPDGRVLYVANRGENNAESYYLPGPEWGSVLAIDTSTGRALDAIVGGNQTTGLDVSADGRYLAFSDFLDDRVQVFALPLTDVLLAGGGGRAGQHLAELAKP